MKTLRDTLMLVVLLGSTVAADALASSDSPDLGQWGNVPELQHKLYVGLWSEHWYADNPEFNEDNEVFMYSLYNPFNRGGEYFSIGTFVNSYGDRSHAVGYGQEYGVWMLPNVKVGWDVGFIHGYGDNLSVNWDGLLPAVKFHFKFFDVVKVQFMGPAVNAGVEFTF